MRTIIFFSISSKILFVNSKSKIYFSFSLVGLFGGVGWKFSKRFRYRKIKDKINLKKEWRKVVKLLNTVKKYLGEGNNFKSDHRKFINLSKSN